jgi:uncharacterized RmlC-like cupin family protein
MKDSGCRVISSGESFRGLQGFSYRAGLTGASVGARGISMTVVTLPPGARASTHLHRGIETAVYVIEGELEMLHGDRLEQRLIARAGEYVYVPADAPHRVMNRSGAPGRAVVAHTAADDQEGIVLLPELDTLDP